MLYFFALMLLALVIQGYVLKNIFRVNTEVIEIYNEDTIPANRGISTGIYTSVDGYRFVNVVVEFEQNSGGEEPISLGVVFAHSQDGSLGSRRYFTFNNNFSKSPSPQMITLNGKSSWHGSQQKKSSYIARLPIMGPYIQVFPFNHYNEERKFSISLYLVE